MVSDGLWLLFSGSPTSRLPGCGPALEVRAELSEGFGSLDGGERDSDCNMSEKCPHQLIQAKPPCEPHAANRQPR